MEKSLYCEQEYFFIAYNLNNGECYLCQLLGKAYISRLISFRKSLPFKTGLALKIDK